MDSPAGKAQESSIGDLFGRLASDGRSFVEAEARLYKAIARHRAAKASSGALALVAGGLLSFAALVTLLVGLALQLAWWVGPALGALIVTVVAALISFVLIRFGTGKLKALSGDEEEKVALALGERSA